MFDNLNYKKKKGFEREREKEFTIDRRVRDLPTRTKLHYLFSEYFSLSFVILIQNLIEFLGFSTFFLERERERVCVAFGLWSMWRDRRESPFYKWLRNSAFYLGGVYFQGLYRFWTNLGRPYIWVLHESLIY